MTSPSSTTTSEHPKFIASNQKEECIRATGLMRAQGHSGRVLDSRPKGRGFEPHQRHCAVVPVQDIFILA